ncbi:MAG: hypothetical protein GY866_36695, partial [Proteobacteria bacterium]|nr:hypothetical protein [Pseudomonadota bacterium]
NVLGGFKLIVALAYYLEWPQKTADVICSAVDALKKSDAFKTGYDDRDRKGRSKSGYFTKRYNQRKEVQANRFLIPNPPSNLHTLNRNAGEAVFFNFRDRPKKDFDCRRRILMFFPTVGGPYRIF